MSNAREERYKAYLQNKPTANIDSPNFLGAIRESRLEGETERNGRKDSKEKKATTHGSKRKVGRKWSM